MHYEIQLRLPFAVKGDVGLFKKGDELVVEIGTLRRHIGLPTSMAALSPGRAKLENKRVDRGDEGELIMDEQQTITTRPGCFFCDVAAPQIKAFIDHVWPQNTREHFRNARIEMLKGMRSMLDARIDHLLETHQPRAQKSPSSNRPYRAAPKPSRDQRERSPLAQTPVDRQHLPRHEIRGLDEIRQRVRNFFARTAAVPGSRRLCPMRSSIAARMTPGATEFTVMLGANALDSACVSIMTPAFDAQ